MDVDSEEGEQENDYGEDGFDITMSDTENFRDAYHEAYKLQELMGYMDNMVNDDEKEHCDCLISLVSFDDTLLRPALEVLGMNPNRVDDDGATPLYAAMMHAKPLAVKLLLANGADPFQCDAACWFPMRHQNYETPDAINCSRQLNTFIRDLADKRQTTQQDLQSKARFRMKRVHKYRCLIQNLLEINTLKNTIFTILAEEKQLSKDLGDDVTTLLRGLEPLALYFDHNSVPGVTKLRTDSISQQWYVKNELSRLNWSKDIKMYFTRGVARMEKLHSICMKDKSKFPVNILHMLQYTKALLANCK